MPSSTLRPAHIRAWLIALDGTEIEIDPVTTPFSGYVFKLQANMDRRHRDSMAFIRICSGRFERDLVVKTPSLRTERSASRARMAWWRASEPRSISPIPAMSSA